MAKSFNEYFSNIGPLLAKKIQKTDVNCLSFLKGDFKNAFAIFDTTPHEIIYISNSLTNKSSAGHDNIPLDIMKFCISYIAQPISIIVNKSFDEGCVPTSLKIARVCPVFKTGDKSRITCSAVALSRVLRTALVPYGNMETSTPHSSETSQVITMKFCTFDNVREKNTCTKFG